MHHAPYDCRTSGEESDLLHAARAHVAETHRYILRRGHDLIGLWGRAGGEKAESEAESATSELFWVKGAAESTLVATMASRLEQSEGLRRRAASDLAHDLATPATVLESQLQADARAFSQGPG